MRSSHCSSDTPVRSVTGDNTFELNPEAEADLLESLAEADRGELIPADEVVAKLRNLS